MISRILQAEVEYEVIEVEGRTFPAVQKAYQQYKMLLELAR